MHRVAVRLRSHAGCSSAAACCAAAPSAAAAGAASDGARRLRDRCRRRAADHASGRTRSSRVEVPVRPDGKISVPLLDDVQAEGLTADGAQGGAHRASSREYITAPDVTVVVTQVNSKRVFVIGEVVRVRSRFRSPRTCACSTPSRVAGGFAPFADKERRQGDPARNGGGEVEYRFDYDAYVAGQGAGHQPAAGCPATPSWCRTEPCEGWGPRDRLLVAHVLIVARRREPKS